MGTGQYRWDCHTVGYMGWANCCVGCAVPMGFTAGLKPYLLGCGLYGAGLYLCGLILGVYGFGCRICRLYGLGCELYGLGGRMCTGWAGLCRLYGLG